MDSFRENLSEGISKEGIPREPVSLMTNTRRQGKNSHYELSLNAFKGVINITPLQDMGQLFLPVTIQFLEFQYEKMK